MLLWTLRCMYPCPYTHVYQGYPPCVFFQSTFHILGFPGGSDSKESPAMLETWVWSLGQEDLLEKEMATHSIILAWRILWTEKPGGLQSVGYQRVEHNWLNNSHFHPSGIHFLSTYLRPSTVLLSKYCITTGILLLPVIHTTTIATIQSTEWS